jgi:hypothetical protein
MVSGNISSCSSTVTDLQDLTSPTNEDSLVVDTTTVLSSVCMYVKNQRNVDSDKSMPYYIFMLPRGINKDIPKMVDILTCEVFKKVNLVLKKRAISLLKPMLCQELKRRYPEKKLNSYESQKS